VNLQSSVPVQALLDEPRLKCLELNVLAGAQGLKDRQISSPRVQKPGLALAGYLPYIKPGRLQILGASEFSYLDTLERADADDRVKQLASLDVPAIVASKGLKPSDEVLSFFSERGVPFLSTRHLTSNTLETISSYLEDEIAPRVQRHGVLVDVFSLGTLIVGDPGIGKSECALELVHRGHRLVADDVVVIRRTHDHGLRGSPHELLKNYIELRGVGIIDVRKHFGMTATSSSVKLSLVIELVKLTQETMEQEEQWRVQLMSKPYAWTSTEEILEIEVPKYTMAVAPGRDVAIMVETAVRKCLLADRGVQDERGFLEAVNKLARGADIGDIDSGDD